METRAAKRYTSCLKQQVSQSVLVQHHPDKLKPVYGPRLRTDDAKEASRARVVRHKRLLHLAMPKQTLQNIKLSREPALPCSLRLAI